MTNRLTGKVALITGTGAGIGRGCALEFARAGAMVFGCDINAERAQATVSAVREAGFVMDSAHPLDLTQPADAQRCVEQVMQRHGRIDILVNAGAINPQFAPLPQLSYEDIWVRTMVGEADIVFLMCKAVWSHMLAGGGGSIVNFASLAALRGTEMAGMMAHCAGKGAVLAMTRQMAVEGGPVGIRANSISPGLVATMATASQGLTEGEAHDRIVANIPLRRIGRPEDIAACALYLASDEASWVTGSNITVDGGESAR